MTETEQHQQTALPLAETVTTRLAESALLEPVKALLRDALGSDTDDVGTTTSSAASGRVYLDSLTVNGFRGIGPRARLSLSPRPGVNLVVGRNGSGKSSLADAIEVGFTGTRAHRPGQDATRGGHWANLHNAESPKIELKLAIEGDTGNSTLTRTWTRGVRQFRGHLQAPGPRSRPPG
ncbi:AAA family ATPase [Streptomyces sp. NPDC001741]|uniref:ATP-binding protein n=1 Tax=Streptomyces sp. NPDC001741 TaxID=3364605 RepID=UPI0036CF3315